MDGIYVGPLLFFVFFFSMLNVLCLIGALSLAWATFKGYPAQDKYARAGGWFVCVAGMYVCTYIVWQLTTQPL